MTSLKIYLCLFFIILLHSCYDTPTINTNTTSPLVWKGALSTTPKEPETNWLYYDTNLKTTFIFDGQFWDTMSIDGIDGVSTEWLGQLAIHPTSAKTNSAYFNTTDKISYIFNGDSWDTLSCSGASGLSLIWKGTLTTAPLEPKMNWAFYNATDKTTYVFNGTIWETLTVSGVDGLTIEWKGTREQAPAPAEENWAYYNSIKRTSYIFSSGQWMVLSKDGPKGESGISIIWQGAQTSHPPTPLPNWAYYNSVNGNSYIYHGNGWQLLAQAGKDGISIEWQGEHKVAPQSPLLNWAYFNTTDGNSYIFNGTTWEILCKSGIDGIDGTPIIWKGTSADTLKDPKLNWVYYNTTNKRTYIWNGKKWDIFSQDGEKGDNGEDGDDGIDSDSGDSIDTQITSYILNGDTLKLKHNISGYKTFIGQYRDPDDSTMKNYYNMNPNWDSTVSFSPVKLLHNSKNSDYKKNSKKELLLLHNGELLSAVYKDESSSVGGVYCRLNKEGNSTGKNNFSSMEIEGFKVIESTTGNLLFTYISSDDSCAYISQVSTEGVAHEMKVANINNIEDITILEKEDKSILIFYSQFYRQDDGHGYYTVAYKVLNNENKLTEEVILDTVFINFIDTKISDIHTIQKQNGEILVAYIGNYYTNTTLLSNDLTITYKKKLQTTHGVTKINNLIQSNSGDIVITYELCLGGSKNGGWYCSYLGVIDNEGGFTQKESLSSQVVSCNYFASKSGHHILMVSFYSSLGIYTFNSNWECLQSQRYWKKSIVDIALCGDYYCLTYADENKVFFQTMKKATKPEIILEELSSKEACLINKTGQDLKMTLKVLFDKD